MLKKRCILLFIFSFLLTFNIKVLADEGHDHDEKIKNAAENFRNGKTESSTEHSDAGEDDSHHDDGSNLGGDDHHEGEESSHGDGGNHQDGGTGHDDNGSHEEEISSHDDSSLHEEEGSGHDDGVSHDEGVSGHDDSGSHEEEGSSHSDDGEHGESGGHSEEVIVEPGPDYKVLGAFGTVNLAFLIIGIWNKWFRRKGE